jgi:hypothetical protein
LKIYVDSVSSVTTLAPLTNTAPFTFQITSSLPIAGLNGTGAGWVNWNIPTGGGTISDVVQTSPTTITFVATPSTDTTVSIGLVSGNVYYNALPGAAYWCNLSSNSVTVYGGTVLPSVAVTSTPNGNLNAPITLAGTYSANGGTSMTQVLVAVTSVATAYPTTT